MTWDVFVAGNALNTEGTGVAGITGAFGALSPRSLYSSGAYGRDGEVPLVGTFESGTFGLNLWVDDHDRTTGLQPALLVDRQAVAAANFAWLMGLFVGDYRLPLNITVPGLSSLTAAQKTRVCDGALLTTVSDPTWNGSRTQASILLGFKNPDVWWRALATSPLDSSGYQTVSGVGNNVTLTLPTTIFPMNGMIDDAILTVNNGANAIKTVTFQAINQLSGSLPPTLTLTTPRTNGVLFANANLVVDCGKFTAVHTSGSTVESVYKFADFFNGRPGSMLRIGQPYQVKATFTPFTTGASMAAVNWSIKYRPSFI